MQKDPTASPTLQERLSRLPEADLAIAFAGLLAKYQTAEKAGNLVKAQPSGKEAATVTEQVNQKSKLGTRVFAAGVTVMGVAVLAAVVSVGAPAVVTGLAVGGVLAGFAGAQIVERADDLRDKIKSLKSEAVQQAKTQAPEIADDDFSVDVGQARDDVVMAAEMLAGRTGKPFIAEPTDTQLIELAAQTRGLAEMAGRSAGRDMGRGAGQDLT